MQNHSSFAKIVYLLALIATIIGFKAFSQKRGENNFYKKEEYSKDQDSSRYSKLFKRDAGSGLDQLDIELKQLDVHIDQLKEQLKNIDFSKTQKQLDAAMQKLDAQNISSQVNESLKKIDWSEVNKQMDKSIAKLNKVKMMEVKKEIEKAKIQLEKQRLNMHFTVPEIDTKKIKLEMEKAMKNARRSVETAKEEFKNLHDFTKALQSDGLIDKSKAYKVEVKEGELYINGKKQPKEISEKYKRYYKKKDFSINLNEDEDTRI